MNSGVGSTRKPLGFFMITTSQRIPKEIMLEYADFCQMMALTIKRLRRNPYPADI